MTGVILCGGESMRMGTDKGLIVHESVTWAALAAGKMRSLQLETILSVNQSQFEVYNKKFPDMALIKDDSRLEAGGPLKGILSVHIQHPIEDLLVLACDMRDMHSDVLQELMKTGSDTDTEALVFRNEELTEPLCGIYTAKGLNKMYALYKDGQLKKFGLLYALQFLDTFYLRVPAEWKKYFTNFNAPQDLSTL